MNAKKISYKISLTLVILIIVLLNLSCISTKATTLWVDSGYTGGPPKKVVVIGLFRNLSSRKVFENEVSKLINVKSGTKAISSLDFMPPDVKYEYKNMENKFKEMGIDGILILRTKSVDKKTNYIPGKTYTVRKTFPMYYYDYPSYHKYYIYTYEIIREPGYYEEAYIVSTESTLFLNADDKMIWMMEKNTTQKYETVDGITNPKQEATRLAGLIRANAFRLETELFQDSPHPTRLIVVSQRYCVCRSFPV